MKTCCLAFVSYLKEEMTSWNNLIDCVSLKVCNTNLRKKTCIYNVFINSECSVAISRSIEVTLHKLRIKLLYLRLFVQPSTTSFLYGWASKWRCQRVFLLCPAVMKCPAISSNSSSVHLSVGGQQRAKTDKWVSLSPHLPQHRLSAADASLAR